MLSHNYWRHRATNEDQVTWRRPAGKDENMRSVRIVSRAVRRWWAITSCMAVIMKQGVAATYKQGRATCTVQISWAADTSIHRHVYFPVSLMPSKGRQRSTKEHHKQ